MVRLQLPESYGFVEIAVGVHEPVLLDAWEANNTFAQIQARHPDDAVTQLNEFVGWLSLKGLPLVSHGAAVQIIDAVAAEIAAAKKLAPC